MEEKENMATDEKVGKMSELEEFDVESLGEIETPTIDFEKFEGNKVKIESADVVSVPSKFSKTGNAPALRVVTEPIKDNGEIVKIGKDGKELRASMLFNLTHTESGMFWNKKGKLAELLFKKNIKHPKELIGKNVVLSVRIKQNPGSAFPQKFLGFQ